MVIDLPGAAAPALCVFCGAKPGDDPRWMPIARGFGAAVAARGWVLVFGGGRVGLMGALADGALEAGGRVVGVIPRSLMTREVAHPGLTRLEVVEDMAVRKTRMIELSDAFATLPGGLGTLDELFEVLTLRQIGEHAKPIGLLDQDGYWQPLLRACASMVEAGFVHPRDLGALVSRTESESLLDAIRDALPGPILEGLRGAPAAGAS
ncbi:MAG TPA: TIGR00730 family Rossman fold protein [Quisquiliibacterium sp.]|nr:TIGR00730 family Rossman fold protein [Quisquiliibacterium sp.]